MQYMVNRNKHKDLIGVQTINNGGILIEHSWGKIVVPKREQSRGVWFKLNPDSKITNIAEFRFEYNNREIVSFCLSAIQCARIIFNEIYSNYFGIPM